MSIRAAQRLTKLSQRHRQGARLIALGLSFVEVSEELGGHPSYWGRLANHSPAFRECLNVFRGQTEGKYQVRATESCETKLAERRWRRREPEPDPAREAQLAWTRAELSRLAAEEEERQSLKVEELHRPTSPDGAAPRAVLPQPPVLVSPRPLMPAGQMPALRTSWQDLIARRQAETAWTRRGRG